MNQHPPSQQSQNTQMNPSYQYSNNEHQDHNNPGNQYQDHYNQNDTYQQNHDPMNAHQQDYNASNLHQNYDNQMNYPQQNYNSSDLHGGDPNTISYQQDPHSNNDHQDHQNIMKPHYDHNNPGLSHQQDHHLNDNYQQNQGYQQHQEHQNIANPPNEHHPNEAEGFLDLKTYINAAEVRSRGNLDDSLAKSKTGFQQPLQGNNEFLLNNEDVNLHYQIPPGSTEKEQQDLLVSLKRQNLKLKEGLKSLNEQLTDLLSKKKTYKPQEVPKPLPGRPAEKPNEEQKLNSELENAKKQLITCQNELKFFKHRFDEANNHNKYYQLEDKNKELDSRIEELTNETRTLQREIRDKAKQVDHFQDSAVINPKESVLGDGLVAMKERFRELNSNEEKYKGQAQQKDEYIRKVQEQLRQVDMETQEVIQKTGYNDRMPLDLAKAKSVPRKIPNKVQSALKISAVSWKSKESDVDSQEFSRDNFMKIQNDVQILQKATEVRDKTRNSDLIGLSNQLTEAEEARLQVETQYDEKQKEVDLIERIYQELNELATNQGMHPSQLEKKAKAAKGKGHNRNNSRDGSDPNGDQEDVPIEEKTDERGKRAKAVGEEDFSDKELIHGERVRICGIRVWHDGKKLNGIQAIYRAPDASKIEGVKNVRDAYKYKATKFDMGDDDYLREFSGYMNSSETAIDCLIFKSFLGETRKVGKASPTSKLFKFDIQSFEYPSSLYGSIREGEDGSVLCRIGVAIASEKAEKSYRNNNNNQDQYENNEEPQYNNYNNYNDDNYNNNNNYNNDNYNQNDDQYNNYSENQHNYNDNQNNYNGDQYDHNENQYGDNYNNNPSDLYGQGTIPSLHNQKPNGKRDMKRRGD